MKLLRIKKIAAILIVVSALFGKTLAQDKIELTWHADGEKIVQFVATLGEYYTIDWGDASPIQTGVCNIPDYVYFLRHTYAEEGEYTMTIAASSASCRFLFFDCAGHDYLIPNPPHNNEVNNLTLTDCSALINLVCYNNRLQLSHLYVAHLIPDNKSLGPQILLSQTADIGEELFPQQSEFNGIFTKYAVTKNGNPAPESDYTVMNGKLTFNVDGAYMVTMTNDAIVSNSPAEVIVTIYVGDVGISEKPSANIKAYPNPTSGQLIVEAHGHASEKIELFNISGKKVFETNKTSFDISHLPAGVYFLLINGKSFKIIKQ